MSKKNNKKKKASTLSLVFSLLLIIAFVAVMAAVIFVQKQTGRSLLKGNTGTEASSSAEPASAVSESVVSETSSSESILSSESVLSAEDLGSEDIAPDESSVYTFLQGPKAWESQTDWSGAWCNEELAGTRFSVFGCGMCCMASIYGSLSPYECSPVDVFDYAQKASNYAPGGGSGAIGWLDMKLTMSNMGFSTELFNKDEDYASFQAKIKECESVIALITSDEDDTFWKDTAGHYITLWNYDSVNDKIFIGEPGNIENNRTWIPLEYVYKALKTQSSYQYLAIYSYNEDDNHWKHNGIDAEWKKPDYYTPKTTE